jgi:hypothetical protein
MLILAPFTASDFFVIIIFVVKIILINMSQKDNTFLFLPLVLSAAIIFSACAIKNESVSRPNIPNSDSPGGLRVLSPDKNSSEVVKSGEEEACISSEFLWNSELGACVRSRDIQNNDLLRAAKLALDNSGLEKRGLSLVQITAAACDGCYLVLVRQDLGGQTRVIRVIIDGWEIESALPAEEEVEPLEAKNAEGILKMIASEYMDIIPEFMEVSQAIVRWKSAEAESQFTGKSIIYGEGYGARDVFVVYQNIIDGFASLGFAADEMNRSFEDGLDITGFKKDALACSVIFSQLGESKLEIRCADME